MKASLTDLMPHIPLRTSNTYVLGRPRWKWIVSAAKALIASSDLHCRWLMVRRGDAEFIRLGKQYFARFEPAIKFSEDELRWILAVITVSLPVRFREAERPKDIAKFIPKKLSDKDLRGSGYEGPTGHDGPTTQHDGGVVIESIADRDKHTRFRPH